MKLYKAAGQYVGTQADAKRLDKEFEPVEVPTDKEGLIAFLNSLQGVPEDDEYEIVVARNDPPVADQPAGDIDVLFEQQPISHQLRLAVAAIDRADNALRSPVYSPAKADAAIEEEDDALFG